MIQKPPVVWCVGGSNSSAHTGLQADLRTGQDLNCHVQTIATYVTTQNSKEVSLDEPLPVAMFNEQWQTLLNGVAPAVIKVSFLPSVELIESCSGWLQKMKAGFPSVLVVFDPVMITSSELENQLQQTSVGSMLLQHILPYVDVVTPNVIEFEVLTGLSLKQPFREQKTEKLHEQLQPFLKQFTCYWLLKGGHLSENQATDWWFDQKVIVGFSSKKLAIHNTHGTGCILSMALASFIAHGYDMLDAMTMAKAYITGALKMGVQIVENVGSLGCPGWPLQIENVPRIISKTSLVELKTKITESKESSVFAKMNMDKMGLYPVVDSIEWLELVLEQGVKIAQLRIKNPEDKQLDSKIQDAITLGKKYQAQVFINDYWRQAIEFGAYGVHLGQEDLDVADLESIQQAGLRLGISTHGYYEIARAQSIQPSYIALGHIFPTQTKDMPSQPQGLQRLNHYSELLKNVFPTVAIGGINAERLPMVAQTSVDSVALVSAITKAKEPEKATRMLMAALVQVKKELDQ